MRPLISVLIPVYQVEGYLGRCLDSVLAQTYPDLEICMVDDGSTDGSAEIGQRYVEQAPMPVSLSRAEHLGVSHARQRLLEQAKGEYLFFLDSDDFLHPQTIETLYRLAVRHGADIVQCKMGHTGEDAMPPMDIDNPDERVYPDREQVMAAYFISTGLPEPGLSQALKGWMEDPMSGELPSYFATVREYWHMGKGELKAKM